MKNQYDCLNDTVTDFSLYDETPLSEEEIRKMSKIINKPKNLKTRIIVVTAAAVFAITTAAAASQGCFDKIIKTITTGHNYFIQIDPEAPHSLPDELKGKLFDADGKALEAISDSDLNNLYDENGKLLSADELRAMYEELDGVSLKSDKDIPIKNYDTLDAAQEDAAFDIKAPVYIPDGYSFDRAYTYTEENGDTSGYYMTLEYTDGSDKTITIFERLINDETAFVSSGDGEIRETVINGMTAVITSGTNIDFEMPDSVSVGIHTHGNIPEDEMIKMAESVE